MTLLPVKSSEDDSRMVKDVGSWLRQAMDNMHKKLNRGNLLFCCFFFSSSLRQTSLQGRKQAELLSSACFVEQEETGKIKI